MSLPPFYVYVDESGDEGFSFARGSSEWFALSAVVVRGVNDRTMLDIVEETRRLYKNIQRKDLHFRDMQEAKRLPYVNTISLAKIRAITVLFHKPPLAEKFDPGTRLYFYAARFLLERVSWLCAGARKKTDGTDPVKIIFSNKAGMSYEQFRSYLDRLKSTPECSIDWSIVDPKRISALQHKERAGLQIADAIASSFYFAVNRKYGVVDDRYARILQPIMYRKNGNYLSYGLKIWPSVPTADAKTYSWVDAYRT